MRLVARFVLAGRRWHQQIPIFHWTKDYSRSDLSSDFSARVVVGMVTAPQAVACAYLAGLPHQAGPLVCLLPILLRMSRTLADAGIGFHLSEIKGPLMQTLGSANLAADISGEIFFSNDEALNALTNESFAKETSS